MIALPHLTIVVALLIAAAPAQAGEVFAGLYAHDVDTPFSKTIHEGGRDYEFGYRWNRLAGLGFIGGPAPYAFASINSRGDTSLAAAGLGWRIGGPIYLRPGIGVAVHTGPAYRVRDGRRTDLGSRVLFEPELAVGFAVLPRASIEASWVHVSHAQLFSHQNPGIDMIGARVAVRLP
jgi:hypothetical protein